MMNQILKEYGLNIEDEKIELLSKYINLLTKAPLNLTSIRDYQQVIHKHIADVLLPVDSIKGDVLDVGSGGGIPGIIYAIVFGTRVTMVESIRKKAIWLEQTIAELGLCNAQVICSRVEELGSEMREKFDVVAARAVAELRILTELCVPFCKVKGELLFYKGPRWNDEYNDAKNAIRTLGIEIEKVVEYTLKTGEKRALLKFRKIKETSEIYPRKISTIMKKPL